MMTEKQKIIQAFKSQDFEALHSLLEDNMAYMDVPKSLFLSTLKYHLEMFGALTSFESVIEGVCDQCNKGCKAYKFKADNRPSLDLYFEETNGKITDIYLCNSIKVETPDDNDVSMYFRFYEDEKVNFSPTKQYTLNLLKIEETFKDFSQFEKMDVVPVKDLMNWYNKNKFFKDALNTNDPFDFKEYKAYLKIKTLFNDIFVLTHNYLENKRAKEALTTLCEINKEDEKSIVKWLIDYKDIFFFSLKKTENWEETRLIMMETTPNILVDSSDFLDSFFFDEIYTKHFFEIMDKYEPTPEQIEKNGGSFQYNLETYLSVNKIYSELF